MKKILFFFCIVYSGSSLAQQVPALNSIKFGINRVGLDAPDALTNHYSLQYNRLIGGGRLKAGARIGYLNTTHSSILPTKPNVRIRQTLDGLLSVDVLRNRVHHLYPGFGFSLWHRDDTIIRQASYTTNPDGSVNIRDFTTGGAREMNFGPYFNLEYELRILPTFSVSVQAGLNNLGKAGWNSNAGVGVGYHF